MDPVAQILQQSQNVSGGAPFGDFFVRGVQSAQQDRQLDQADRGLNLEEELNTARIQDLGAKAVAGRAAQKLKLKQRLLSGPTAKMLQDWINRKSPMGELGAVVATLSNLNEDDPVREFGMKHVSMVSAAEDATAERAAIRKEEIAQAAERLKLGQQRAGNLPVYRVTADGVTFQNPPAASSRTVFDSEGNPIFQEATGNVGEGSAGITSKFQEQISSHEIARTNINLLREVAGPGSFGVDGLLASANNRLLAPAKAFFGLEPGVDIAFATLEKRLAQVRTAGLKSLKFDTQMNARDFAEVEAGLPEMGVSQTFEEFNVALNELETVNNLGEFVKRRNADGIPMQPMLDRMGRSEVIEFITRGVATKLMSKSEARNLLTQAGLGVAGN